MGVAHQGCAVLYLPSLIVKKPTDMNRFWHCMVRQPWVTVWFSGTHCPFSSQPVTERAVPITLVDNGKGSRLYNDNKGDLIVYHTLSDQITQPVTVQAVPITLIDNGKGSRLYNDDNEDLIV